LGRKEEYNNIISTPAPNQRHRRASVTVTCLGRLEGEGNEKYDPTMVNDQVSTSDTAAAFPLFRYVAEFNERKN